MINEKRLRFEATNEVPRGVVYNPNTDWYESIEQSGLPELLRDGPGAYNMKYQGFKEGYQSALEDAAKQLQAMRASFHVNMLHAYPHKSHDEIASEINKALGVPALEDRQGEAVDAARYRWLRDKRADENFRYADLSVYIRVPALKPGQKPRLFADCFDAAIDAAMGGLSDE